MRETDLNALLRQLVESGEGVSDLNFTPGKPPQVEIGNELSFPFVTPPLPELSPFMTEQIALALIGKRPALLRKLVKTGSCDFAYSVPRLSRFRTNVFSQRGSFSIVLRRLATRVPSIHDLVLPPVFERMATLRDGLVLVTGGPGDGKTTSLSALVREINLTRPVHIVTLEDPIEFLHGHQIGTVNQRERGPDFDTFASGLRAALRQSPKVIVVGELRDRETVETALTAAETGHLVLSTMQTRDAIRTVERLVGLFDAAEQPRIRARLAETLRYVVAQALVPRREGGRIAALEILASNYRTQQFIRDPAPERERFYRTLSEGAADGMQTIDQHLAKLFEDGLISEETCRNFCSGHPDVMREMERIRHEIAAAERAADGPPAAPTPEADDLELKMDYTFGRTREDV